MIPFEVIWHDAGQSEYNNDKLIEFVKLLKKKKQFDVYLIE